MFRIFSSSATFYLVLNIGSHTEEKGPCNSTLQQPGFPASSPSWGWLFWTLGGKHVKPFGPDLSDFSLGGFNEGAQRNRVFMVGIQGPSPPGTQLSRQAVHVELVKIPYRWLKGNTIELCNCLWTGRCRPPVLPSFLPSFSQ